MTKEVTESKIALFKGALKLFWLELKTLNWEKLKVMAGLIKGYFRMKLELYRSKHHHKKDFHLSDR